MELAVLQTEAEVTRHEPEGPPPPSRIHRDEDNYVAPARPGPPRPATPAAAGSEAIRARERYPARRRARSGTARSSTGWRGTSNQIYSTVSPALDGEALERLERDINSAAEPGGDGQQRAVPGGRGPGSTRGGPCATSTSTTCGARDAGEDADEKSTVHPLYFVVADRADWKREGLLAVHLDCRCDEDKANE
ncbi:hypothetical protein DL762_008117 [Monosporascus cannonballus]|uniref:Uncharacterized protein n=1 Tax=Monosporascus cannonballus TaxID=155416 RepID=A0ABY0GXD2_9PEZI|nr:hypothetical protein DL762_008117 [Monosporascus cannonballus]